MRAAWRVPLQSYDGGEFVAKVLHTVNRWMNYLMLFLSELALAAMALIVIMSVILRYFFNSGIAWAEEVPRLLVGYFAFFACAMGVRDREHMSMDFFYELFPKNGKIRAMIDVFADLCVLACGLFMFYYGGLRVLKMMSLSGCLPITQWPNWVRYAAVPVAGFIMIFDCILFLTKVIKPGDKLFSEPEEEQAMPLTEGQKEAGE